MEREPMNKLIGDLPLEWHRRTMEKLASRIRAWNQTGRKRMPEAEALDHIEFVLAELPYKPSE